MIITNLITSPFACFFVAHVFVVDLTVLAKVLDAASHANAVLLSQRTRTAHARLDGARLRLERRLDVAQPLLDAAVARFELACSDSIAPRSTQLELSHVAAGAKKKNSGAMSLRVSRRTCAGNDRRSDRATGAPQRDARHSDAARRRNATHAQHSRTIHS